MPIVSGAEMEPVQRRVWRV